MTTDTPARTVKPAQKTIEIYHVATGEVIERMKTPVGMVAGVLAGIRPIMGDDYGARVAG